jgi:hypothetical protein
MTMPKYPEKKTYRFISNDNRVSYRETLFLKCTTFKETFRTLK